MLIELVHEWKILPHDQWVHIVVRYEDGGYVTYIDGVRQ